MMQRHAIVFEVSIYNAATRALFFEQVDFAFAIFTFLDDATPTVLAVTPAVAGPGVVVKIHAWTCGEELDASKPIVLIPAVGMDTNYASKADDDAGSFGSVCEPHSKVGDTDVSGAIGRRYEGLHCRL